MPKSVIDLSEFETLNGLTGRTGRCAAGEFIASLSDEDQQKINAALAKGSIQASAIHKWMQQRGYQPRSDSVRKHRRKECACARS